MPFRAPPPGYLRVPEVCLNEAPTLAMEVLLSRLSLARLKDCHSGKSPPLLMLVSLFLKLVAPTSQISTYAKILCKC